MASRRAPEAVRAAKESALPMPEITTLLSLTLGVVASFISLQAGLTARKEDRSASRLVRPRLAGIVGDTAQTDTTEWIASLTVGPKGSRFSLSHLFVLLGWIMYHRSR